MVRYILTFIAMVAALGAAAGQAAEELPAAYVLEVDGGAPPGLEEFAAINAGTAFVLPGSTTVAFSHLAMCQTIRVKGGILIINEKDYSNPGGEVIGTEPAECPKTITIESEGVVGGVRLRSFGKKRAIEPSVIHWALPVRPVIFLRGKNAAAVERIKMMNDATLVIELPASRDPVVWPGSAASLAYDTPYLMKLEDGASSMVSETWVRTMGRDEERRSSVVFLYID